MVKSKFGQVLNVFSVAALPEAIDEGAEMIFIVICLITLKPLSHYHLFPWFGSMTFFSKVKSMS